MAGARLDSLGCRSGRPDGSVQGGTSDAKMTETVRQPQARDYFIVLFRRRWIIIQAFVVIVATVAVGTFAQTPIYRASTALLVETSCLLYTSDAADE